VSVEKDIAHTSDPESLPHPVLAYPDGCYFVPESRRAEVHDLSAEVVKLMAKHDPSVAWAAVQYALGVMWPNNTSHQTITECMDRWRLYSGGIELFIRKSFGEIRYGGSE
jgi:hypothetical protein